MSAELQISEREFALFQALMHRACGVQLGAAKQAMVTGRLGGRLHAVGARSFGDYHRHISQAAHHDELQRAIDLLTTHETFFFREPRHFELLAGLLDGRPRHAPPLRAWSAAASTGEEAYSIAMVLADKLGLQASWEVVGTDVSADTVARASSGRYGMHRLDGLPPACLRRYCLRGTGPREGTLMIDPVLRRRCRFLHANLCEDQPALGRFDIVFLRNVMIYFDAATKARVVELVLRRLAPDGLLFIGHSESLHGMATGLRQLQPTVYCRAA